jgi:hypothetical protein
MILEYPRIVERKKKQISRSNNLMSNHTIKKINFKKRNVKEKNPSQLEFTLLIHYRNMILGQKNY